MTWRMWVWTLPPPNLRAEQILAAAEARRMLSGRRRLSSGVASVARPSGEAER